VTADTVGGHTPAPDALIPDIVPPATRPRTGQADRPAGPLPAAARAAMRTSPPMSRAVQNRSICKPRRTATAPECQPHLFDRGSVTVRRLANPVTFCDGHGVLFVAASGQIRMAANRCERSCQFAAGMQRSSGGVGGVADREPDGAVAEVGDYVQPSAECFDGSGDDLEGCHVAVLDL
jgi:hypothetical protein